MTPRRGRRLHPATGKLYEATERICEARVLGRLGEPLRMAARELLHALVGEAEEIRGIADAQAKLVNESLNGFQRRRPRRATSALELVPRAEATAYRRSSLCWKPDIVDELGSLGIVDPEGERFPHPTLCLDEAPTVGVTARAG